MKDLKYRIIKDSNKYLVWENSTKQYIAIFHKSIDAKKYVDFYKSGGGFAGHTPSFMIKSEVKNEIRRYRS